MNVNWSSVSSICVVLTFLFTVFGAIIRAVIRDIVRQILEEHRKWLKEKFDSIEKWQNNHMRDGHNGPVRPRR